MNDPYDQAGFVCIGQIRKGAEKSQGRIGPDLDHFRAVFHKGEDESAALFRERFGTQPKQIEIMFPFDEPDRVWSFGLEAYTGKGIRVMLVDPDTNLVQYWLDPHEMKVVVRNGLDATGKPVEWDGQTPAYSYRSRKNDQIRTVMPKLTCRLRVMVPALARVVYMLVMTGSWNDRRNITRQLNGLYQLRGSLKGIPLMLRRRPQVVPTSRPDGSKFREEKSLISIEPTQEWATLLFQEMQTAATPGLITIAPSPAPEPDTNEPQKPDAEQETSDDWQEDPLLWLDSMAVADWSFHDAACEHQGYTDREHVIQVLNDTLGPGWSKFNLRDLWATLEEHAPDGGDATVPDFVKDLKLDDESFYTKAAEIFGFDNPDAVRLFLDDEAGNDWPVRLSIKEAWVYIDTTYNESVDGGGGFNENLPLGEQESFDIPF